MLRYMLDTNICIFGMKDLPTWLPGKLNRHMHRVCISTITLGELRTGAERSLRRADNLRIIDDFASRIVVLDFDRSAAAGYARVRAALRRQPIGSLDMLIAGHALSQDLTIVTNNIAEFERVPGLGVEDWSTRPGRR